MYIRIIVFFMILSIFGCSQDETSKVPPNVLFISIDTLRSDHLGCYGYNRQTSPNIDKLAKSGAVFDNMMSTSCWTLPSHASMFTGTYPAHHGLQDDGVKLDPDIPTLAEFFRNQGYYTMAVVSHIYVSSVFGLDRGFDEFDDSLIKDGTTNPIAGQVVDRFLMLAEKTKPNKFFGFIHFFDPHLDYLPPPPFNTKFTDPDYDGDVDGTMATLLKYFYKSKYMPEADRKKAIALYDGEIAYVDSEVGRLINKLKKLGMMNNTVVIVTSDHGEEFKEHGQLGHARTLYEEQTHVPLIISGHPKFPAKTHRKELVSTCDLAPTLLDLIGLKKTDIFQGVSVLKDRSDYDRTLFAETIRFGFEKRSARQGKYKIVDIQHDNKRVFFNLEDDPKEIEPIVEDPTGGKLSAALKDYSASVDSGWHLKLIALHRNSFRVKATITTSGQFINPRHYFSDLIANTLVKFYSFELSKDKKTLLFDVVVQNTIGEVVFNTDSSDAEVTFKITTTGPLKKYGVFLGKGVRIPNNKPITLKQSDPRIENMPENYLKALPGIYLRAVNSEAKTALKTNLSEGAIEHLKSLGYIE